MPFILLETPQECRGPGLASRRDASRGEASARMNALCLGGSTSSPNTVFSARGVRRKRAAKAERDRCV
jgi:hypothetical protein